MEYGIDTITVLTGGNTFPLQTTSLAAGEDCVYVYVCRNGGGVFRGGMGDKSGKR